MAATSSKMGRVDASTELLERSRHLSALREALEEVRADGRGRLIAVAGEAGVGNTVELVRRYLRNRLPIQSISAVRLLDPNFYL